MRIRAQASFFEATLLIAAAYMAGVDANRSPNLGLNSSNMRLDGIFFGAIPAFKEPSYPNTPFQINAKLPRPISIMGDYVELEKNAEGLRKIDWVSFTHAFEDTPESTRKARLPNRSNAEPWSTERFSFCGEINRVASKMAEINRKNVTVWLRFGHEVSSHLGFSQMNGQWYNWGEKPSRETYLFYSRTNGELYPLPYGGQPQTHANMMWAPNARFGSSIDSVHGGYTQYWPGGEYVDIAVVSIKILALSYYHFGGIRNRSYGAFIGTRRRNIVPKENQALDKLQEFAKVTCRKFQLYGSEGEGKPIVVAETSAPYTRLITTKQPERGGASEREIKLTWLKQLFSPAMKRSVPDLKAISWVVRIGIRVLPSSLTLLDKIQTFDSGRNDAKSEDFRLLMGNAGVAREAYDYMSQRLSTEDE
ncbi:hypothetical protein VP01_1899g3 [Puccinia sorghi]|uniref:Uncharacterized protein n=1 Tax=Puccinia sorghi TaxID=27349 RepID=A0A0L6VCU3_9BASI|nr:hypothetical protein VP01_1899g3 [Puccinia sorghi]